MRQWKLRRLVPTRQQGWWVDLHGTEGPELHCPDGRVLPITDDLGEHHLLWKLLGCESGASHYWLATSKSVVKLSDLWCPVCMYNEQLWKEEHKRVLPESELWFMALLLMWGVDRDFACQVMSHFWCAPLDFYSLQHGYFVQVDGRCHWEGMRQHDRDAVLKRDMEQNVAAVLGGAALVRVHTSDLTHEACVHAALHAATSGCSIVLTPAYAAETYKVNGQQATYLHALLQLVPYCCYDTGQYGNHMLWKV